MTVTSFEFKKFIIYQDACGMKVGTDGVLLGAWADGGKNILDVGTGTGLIAMMMAQRFHDASIDAIDIDKNACEQARQNVANSIFAGRIATSCISLQEYVVQCDNQGPFSHLAYDSIVSNPPYFINSLKNPDNKRAIARHSDTLSYRDLFDGVSHLLAENGKFSVIIPMECMDSFVSESYIFGLFLERKCLVRTTANKQVKRVLLAFCRHPSKEIDEQEDTLLDSLGKRTEWYKKLTGDFYLK
jgi:tRNA1Val (adenine37-N6)-methyltransferase